MDEGGPDSIRVMPATTDQPSSQDGTSNPRRTLRLFTGRLPRSSRVNSKADFVKEMDNAAKRVSSSSPAGYGYLEHIQSYKELCTPDNKSLKKKVREFYTDQLEFITSLEEILSPTTAESDTKATTYVKRQQRIVKILTIVTLVTNIILVIMKIVAAVISKSLSVISSVVDSVVDLLTSVILMWTAHKIKNRDAYKYPTGRTRLEPIAVVILSVIMCSASVQVIFESGQTLAREVEYFTDRVNRSACTTLPELDMSTVPIIAMVLTIVSKSILFVLCYRIKNPTMYALAEDHRNDVVSNIVALTCGLLGSYALRNRIRQEVVVVDPAGAIVISVYIILAWIRQANRQIRHLSGHTAEAMFVQRLTHFVYNYRPDVITKIDTVRAVHFGTQVFVEVDIGLPGSMPLAIAHDIGADLQEQLEKLDEVERAYVHLDFEFTHMPATEHKVL